MSESTAHRLLSSLVSRGYLRQNAVDKRYGLGPVIVALARKVSSEVELLRNLRPYLERVSSQVPHATNLGQLSDLDVVYLDCVTPSNMFSLYVPPGSRAPAYATAMGKVLLAFMPATLCADVLQRMRLVSLTPNTVHDVRTLRRMLADIRSKGYAIDRGELREGVHCVAVPLREHDGTAVAAISVTGYALEDATWEDRAVDVLVKVASDASRELFQGP